MNRKTLIILTIIFGILALAAFSPILLKKPEKISDSIREIDLSETISSKIERIIFQPKDKGAVKIERNNGNWTVNGVEASSAHIDKFIEDFKNTNISKIVSRNVQNHVYYSIEDKEANILSVTQEGKQRNYFIGTKFPTPKSFYIKIPGSPNVYLAYSSLMDFFNAGVDFWREKEILGITDDSIKKIELKEKDRPKIEFEKVKKDNIERWIYKKEGKEQELSQKQAAQIISYINPLNATGFLNELEIKEFNRDNEYRKIIIKGDGYKKVLRLLRKDFELWVSLEGNPYFYKMSSMNIDTLFSPEKLLNIKNK
jgi:hypothetical protein